MAFWKTSISVVLASILSLAEADQHRRSHSPQTLDRVQLDPNTRQFVSTVDGRTVIFHGLAQENNGAPNELVNITDSQMAFMRKWGFNIVRLGFHWHKTETRPNYYNQTYLGLLQNTVRRLGEHGIYVILDMHQDSWSPRFCGGHGIPEFYAKPYNNSEYYKNGSRAYPEPIDAPEYEPDGVHIKNCDKVYQGLFGWATSYVTYATGAAAQRLYDNDSGLLDAYARFWRMIATLFKDEPNVLGYELLNEPWLGDAPLSIEELNPLKNKNWDLWFPKVADQRNMKKFYKALHDAIREVDNETVIFFEPATGGNYLDAFPMGLDEGPGGSSYNNRQALAYHVYCPVIDWQNTTSFWQEIKELLNLKACDLFQSPLFEVRYDDAKRIGVGAILTEFGAVGNSPIAEDIINFVVDKMDAFLHGWTFWYLTPAIENEDSLEVKALTRTYARRVAGDPHSVTFFTENGNFTLVYRPNTAERTFSSATEIFLSPFYYHSMTIKWLCFPTGALTKTVSPDNPRVWLFEHTESAKTTEEVILHIHT